MGNSLKAEAAGQHRRLVQTSLWSGPQGQRGRVQGRLGAKLRVPLPREAGPPNRGTAPGDGAGFVCYYRAVAQTSRDARTESNGSKRERNSRMRTLQPTAASRQVPPQRVGCQAIPRLS